MAGRRSAAVNRTEHRSSKSLRPYGRTGTFCPELTEPARRPAISRVAVRQPAGRRRAKSGDSATAKIGAGLGHKCTCASTRFVRSRAERKAGGGDTSQAFHLRGEGKRGQRGESAAKPECAYAAGLRQAIAGAATPEGRGKNWRGALAPRRRIAAEKRGREERAGMGEGTRPWGYGAPCWPAPPPGGQWGGRAVVGQRPRAVRAAC